MQSETSGPQKTNPGDSEIEEIGSHSPEFTEMTTEKFLKYIHETIEDIKNK